jgi:LysM domain
MSALSSIEAALCEEPPFEPAAASSAQPQHVRLVPAPSRPVPSRPVPSRPVPSRPVPSGLVPPRPDHLPVRASERAHSRREHSRRDRVPVRLTRRGRLVVGALAVVLAAAIMTVISMAASGGAQAANHGRQGAGYQGLRQIVVQPGQTLWSIAAKAEPSADPRLVVAQIMAANSLTTTAVQAGQELWVPK